MGRKSTGGSLGRNPNTKAPTTFADAFEAINSLSLEYSGEAGPEAVPFEFKPDYVRSIYGRKNAISPLGLVDHIKNGGRRIGRRHQPKSRSREKCQDSI
jgi:hypothetical protein